MRTITELENIITKAANDYYSGKESMTDKQYDALIEELRALDPNNPLIPGLAGDETNPAGYPKVNHILTTGTLDKAMTTSVFEKWFNNKKKSGTKRFNISTKQDGIGIELQYENGKLVHLVSRGDGFSGFDKIVFADYVTTINKTIPDLSNKSQIRGELEVRNELFKDPYFEGKKNPRNAVAGLFNRKASELSEEDKRILSQVVFIAYDYHSDGHQPNTKSAVFDLLTSMSFITPAYETVTTLDEIYAFRNKYGELRVQDNQFALDGIVIFDDEVDYRDQLEKVQKSAIALKFDLTIAISKIIGIDWNYKGRYFNPIAVLEPVELDGTTVTHANLCNLSIITNLGIKIGDTIAVAKKGEIIPQIQYKVA